MPDSFDLNDKSRAADAAPQIPTSSSEVAVRTMESDVQLMGQSGGMIGQTAPQGVQVPVALHPDNSNGNQPSSGRGKIILITVAIILGVLGLFALGFFVIGK